MKLSEVPYSKSQINKAARNLARRLAALSDKGPIVVSPVEMTEDLKAMSMLNSWRASHLLPLRVATTLIGNKCRAVDTSALVSQRQKRMTSILSKLQRNQKMNLTQMQDIGGCRAVMASQDQVTMLSEYCREIAGEPVHDYIVQPKTDGYRSVHFVYTYEPSDSTTQHLAGRQIEIQIRTRLQHAWATAVETVDLFTRQTLKTGGGDPNWKRFFALVASVFAVNEKCPTVPDTPNTLPELIDAVRPIWRQLRVFRLLKGWSQIIRDISPSPSELGLNAMYLVDLDVGARTMHITVWNQDKLADAQTAYAEAEARNRANHDRSAVLVSVDSLNSMREAYPSYYGDTTHFLERVIAQMGLITEDDI